MPKILSISEAPLPFEVNQATVGEFVKDLHTESIADIKQLLKVFENGSIRKRNFVKSLDWYKQDHSFTEKNNIYIESSVKYGAEAINRCLSSEIYLNKPIPLMEIEAFFFVSSTGLATPSIDARIMNQLPFQSHTKRIPLWGLGCAGGASGLSRAFEYCKAFPYSKVIVLSVELCSLTFQRNDYSKSNIIGTSLFADGVACACVVGDQVDVRSLSALHALPSIEDTQSTLLAHSEDIMGWDIRDQGLFVIFSKDIPQITRTWLQPNVEQFMIKNHIKTTEIEHFILHPGGRKVIEAYEECLNIDRTKTHHSFKVLEEHGNMSSATIFFVLNRIMHNEGKKKDLGIVAALGPGFSSELLLLKWE